ncbi:MAG: TIGR02391 family protein, partial [Erysipelotrichaceae bacterium]|nr:TIGR02391 family protein [Erysipelotrichaceae bacterium]
NSNQIENISKLLGDLLNGSEISKIFRDISVTDNSGESTKWRRLDYVFKSIQNRDKSINTILRFIKEALSPVSYINKQSVFESTRTELNKILMFSGLEYCVDGNFKKVTSATTITEVQRRTNSLRDKLIKRGVHHRVLKYCNEELLKENYFHSVLEATKSLCEFIREQTGLIEDGTALIDKAFSIKDPYLALNALQTDSEKNQQVGLAMMLKGINSMARNVTAHAPKIKWIINESEAIDILMTISFLHKNLDNCIVVPK